MREVGWIFWAPVGHPEFHTRCKQVTVMCKPVIQLLQVRCVGGL